MKLKRILSVALALVLALSLLPSMVVSADEATTVPTEGESVATQTPNEEIPAETPPEQVQEEESDLVTEEEAFAQMKKVAEKDGLEMYISEGEFLNIAIKNTKTGEIWFTNPVNALSKTTREKGIPKTTLASQLYVVTVDIKGTTFYANSQIASYTKGTYEIKTNDDGITVIYDFSRKTESFKVPVKYSIKDGSFKASILVNEIEEYGSQRILSLSILPHFGAGDLDDEGYMLIPDGSGAVINFNNGKGDISSVSMPLFGGDKSDQSELASSVTANVTMPVFGIVNNNKGYVAVVEGADGTIEAAGSSASATYNHVYSTFTMRKKDTYQTNEGSWKATELIIIGQYPYSSYDFSVEYMFLDQDDVSYSGMARRYREYLIEEKGLEKKTDSFSKDLPLFMEIYGELPRETSILGVPVTHIEALSSYDEVANIIKQSNEKGIKNLIIDYIGWQKGGPNTKVPTKLKFSSKLGGKSAYTEMLKVASEYNAKVFPRVEMMSFEEGGNGYSKITLAAKAAIRTPIQRYLYRIGAGTRIRTLSPTYLLKTNLYDEITNKFVKALDKLNLDTVALDTAVNHIYSDFQNKELFDMYELENTLVQQYKKLAEKNSVLMKAPNSYAMPYADYILSLPSFSSDYLICDYEVPFVQTVLHGYASYSSEPISSSEDTQEAFLKAIETGSALSFTITANSARVMKDSYQYNFLYCSDYKLWIDTAAELYEEINSILADLQTVEIQNHERLQKDVFKTTYANGTSVIVNYSDEAVTIDTVTVEANSYKVVKGGAQ